MLLQQNNINDFYFLHVPFAFFAENQSGLDIRGDKFDLHLSANRGNWLTDKRGTGALNFSKFLINA